MDELSGRQRLTLAALSFVLAAYLVTVYMIGSGIIQVTPPAAGGPLLALTIALGFFALPLVWWGLRWGYLSAMVVAILAIVGQLVSFVEVAAARHPAELLVLTIPELLFGLLLLYAAFTGWRE